MIALILKTVVVETLAQNLLLQPHSSPEVQLSATGKEVRPLYASLYKKSCFNYLGFM